MIQFDEHIFQMGWFNRQPVMKFTYMESGFDLSIIDGDTLEDAKGDGQPRRRKVIHGEKMCALRNA